jgi:PhnB protein
MTTVIPYLTVHDGTTALDFYAAAFGAEVTERFDDGTRLAHATMIIGDAVIMVSDEYRDLGAVAPHTLGGATTAIVLQVTDPDETFARAVRAGATAQRPVEEDGSGARSGWLVDPYGHRWNIRSAG